MSTWPAPSILDPATQMFPTLTEAQVHRICPSGKRRKVETGEILFKPNDTNIPFFVMLSGKLEILQPGMDVEKQIVTHGAHQFTGEMSMITGARCLVLGRITEPGEVLEVTADGLRSLVAKDAELGEIFMRAFILRRLALIREGLGPLVLLGSRHSAATLRLREFLGRNAYPYKYIDLDIDKDSQILLDRFDIKASEIPVVMCNTRGSILKNPTVQQLADRIGFNVSIDGSQVRDVIIVGGGPSGLAAAVYAASEGLDALVIEAESPGGQAGSSSKIENYLGFPTGVSGQELTNRALAQAQKFGARMMIGHGVTRLDCSRRPYKIVLDNGDELAARSIVISTGAQYNKPDISNLKECEGRGVYYGATWIEAQLCVGEEVVVVGGANSAGQAAVYLAQNARKVHMLVRRDGLAETMSRYLIQRITENPNIELHCNTEIVSLEGDADGQLRCVTWRNKKTGKTSVHEIGHIFIMTGASPRTDWLKGCVALDEKGFILTGRDLIDGRTVSDGNGGGAQPWTLPRPPQMFETSLPSVFAVGDVRAGNVKRVASAVGEGAIAIYMVHRALAEH
ncbi:MAG TPA: FAD-dependent oxidoreductase [Terriglobales bacterium]|nr:FAD-dependent oxidoreductase [Terriglobales bacterium]